MNKGKESKIKMKKSKTQKGITLIALIITIVVLLILAVVAIIAIQNDGIISKAQDSTNRYNQSVANEQGTLQGYKDFLDRYNGGSGTGNGGSTGGEEQNDEDLELLELYFLGDDKTGRNLSDIYEYDSDNEEGQFKNDSNTIADASTSIIEVSYGTNYFKYNNKLYTYSYKYENKGYDEDGEPIDEVCITQSVSLVYEKNGNEGKLAKYDSDGDGKKEDWMVLTDRNGLLEIVRAEPIGSLTLGKEDTSVNVTADLDGDGTIGNDADKAIASYNNAIKTINDYCKSLVTATDNEGVRSVGGTDETIIPYSEDTFVEWYEGDGPIADGDNFANFDYAKLMFLNHWWDDECASLWQKYEYDEDGEFICVLNFTHWIASRYIDFANEEDWVWLFLGVMVAGEDEDDGGTELRDELLYQYDNTESLDIYSKTFPVRPVIINPQGIEIVN